MPEATSPGAPTKFQRELVAANAELNAASAGLGDLANLAVAAGIPWQRVLAYQVTNGLHALLAWLKELNQSPPNVVPPS